MVLSRDELSRLNEKDTYTDRRITTSIYCGKCGYNLRTLPYVYTCPECGNAYNARPVGTEGIYTAHEVAPPIGGSLGSILALAVTAALVHGGLNPVDEPRLYLAGGFLLTAAYFGIRAAVGWRNVLRHRTVTRRIDGEDG
ncbi:MAG: hypothetical protein HY763_06640 [Planctomycetes bacterium]|nr:hypothetical protein [Planctomycetota bacterium]